MQSNEKTFTTHPKFDIVSIPVPSIMALFTTKTYGQKNKKTIFVFGGIGNSRFIYWFLGNVLSSHGYKTIVYTFDPSLLSPNPSQTRKNFQNIVTDVTKKIKSLPKKEQKDLSVFGTGLGTIPTFMVANEIKTIKKVIANTPPAELNETVWQWDTKKFNYKKQLQTKKVTRKQLHEEWFELNPINNLDTFTDKKVLIYAIEHDDIIPYDQTLQLIKQLEKEEIPFEATINSRHKHVVGSILSLVRYQVYLRFLAAK